MHPTEGSAVGRWLLPLSAVTSRSGDRCEPGGYRGMLPLLAAFLSVEAVSIGRLGDAPHSDLPGEFQRLAQVVINLHPQPGFGAAAERLGQPNRHLLGSEAQTGV